MDPVSCVALATGAYKTIRAAISTGKDLQDMTGTWTYGPSAWKEVLAIEAEMRRKRKQELYRKQEQIDAMINFAIGATIFVISGGILFVIFYYLGKWQGRW